MTARAASAAVVSPRQISPSEISPSADVSKETHLSRANASVTSFRAITSVKANPSPNGVFRRLLPWWLMSLAALLLPWLLLPWLGLGAAQTWLAQPLSLAEFWKALWPLLLGVVAALVLWRWGERLPRVPPGDMLIWSAPLSRFISALGAGVETLDPGLRQWPVAGLALLILSLLLWGGVLKVQ